MKATIKFCFFFYLGEMCIYWSPIYFLCFHGSLSLTSSSLSILCFRPAGGRSTWTATACDLISYYLTGASAVMTVKVFPFSPLLLKLVAQVTFYLHPVVILIILLVFASTLLQRYSTIFLFLRAPSLYVFALHYAPLFCSDLLSVCFSVPSPVV